MDYFCFFVLGLFINIVRCQFPKHIDLQKVGQITFQGETYNVLKSTAHEVTDHFKDYMLRRDTRPDERVFIDDDGFRHRWNGFGLRTNLRKSHKHNKDNAQDTDVDTKNKYDDDLGLLSEEKGLPDDAFVYLRHRAPLRQATKKPAVTTKKPAVTTKKAAATTQKPAVTTKKAVGTTKAVATTKQPAGTTKVVATTIKAEVGRSRTAAKTYFFCPFFGVITMRAFID